MILSMKFLILGGTGSIGSAIVATLIQRGLEVLGLARSRKSADKLELAGATPIMGDIKDPGPWLDIIESTDGVVQAAATWGDDMHRVEKNLVESLLSTMSRLLPPKALIYTGGCWLYGNTGDRVATETSPLDPYEEFDGSISIIPKVLSASNIRGMVIHPAMVYEKNGGVFSHFYRDAEELGYLRVIGSEQVRWPLVHPEDLALLYALMLEKGVHGDVYNAAAVEGYPVGKISRALAQILGLPAEPRVLEIAEAIEAYGPFAEGYAIDQQMSARRAIEQLNWQPRHLDPIADLA